VTALHQSTLTRPPVLVQACYNPVLHAFDFYCAGDGDYSLGLGECPTTAGFKNWLAVSRESPIASYEAPGTR
jgi:hypothetical protein